MKVESFKDYVDQTSETIDSATGNGTSVPIYIGKRRYDGTPYTIQIFETASAAGTIQGVLAKDGDTAAYSDASTKWQDMTNGTIDGDGLFHLYAPVTWIRINLSAGTCEAEAQY